MRDIKIGDHVYYRIEDYDTGDKVLYEGYVIGTTDHTIKLKGEDVDLGKFYNISDKPDGEMIMGLQRNRFYTIEDLFNKVDKYEDYENLKYEKVKIAFVKGNEGYSMLVTDKDGNGYRIAGPKAWGNPTNIPTADFTINSKEIIDTIINRSYTDEQ